MIKVFQKRGIGILQDIPKYDFFSTPDHAVLSEFTEVKVTLKTYCGRRIKRVERMNHH